VSDWSKRSCAGDGDCARAGAQEYTTASTATVQRANKPINHLYLYCFTLSIVFALEASSNL
jgi:hypothetical protein